MSGDRMRDPERERVFVVAHPAAPGETAGSNGESSFVDIVHAWSVVPDTAGGIAFYDHGGRLVVLLAAGRWSRVYDKEAHRA